jgi:quercetin dioxygenase-like cupin family protein
LIATIMLGAVMLSFAGNAVAQDATPPAGPIAQMELAPGFAAEVLAAAPSALAPGQTVYIARFIIQPGAAIFEHGHPGTTVLSVVEGTFGWTLDTGTAYVVRGAASGAPSAPEVITEPGTEVILEVGDAIYYESDVTHTARGAGDTPTVVLGTLVLETGAPLLMPAGMDMSTPSA